LGASAAALSPYVQQCYQFTQSQLKHTDRTWKTNYNAPNFKLHIQQTNQIIDAPNQRSKVNAFTNPSNVQS
jgi:hypothetical protein